jgi:hypothetical protein
MMGPNGPHRIQVIRMNQEVPGRTLRLIFRHLPSYWSAIAIRAAGGGLALHFSSWDQAEASRTVGGSATPHSWPSRRAHSYCDEELPRLVGAFSCAGSPLLRGKRPRRRIVARRSAALRKGGGRLASLNVMELSPFGGAFCQFPDAAIQP